MTTDHAIGLAELVSLIQLRITAWHEYGYEHPPTPDSAKIPPLGERSAEAIKAGHGAVEVIDDLTRQLHLLRAQLVNELHIDQVRVMERSALALERSGRLLDEIHGRNGDGNGPAPVTPTA